MTATLAALDAVATLDALAALNGHASLYVGIVFVLFVLYVPDGLVGTIRNGLGGPVAKRLPERLWGDR